MSTFRKQERSSVRFRIETGSSGSRAPKMATGPLLCAGFDSLLQKVSQFLMTLNHILFSFVLFGLWYTLMPNMCSTNKSNKTLRTPSSRCYYCSIPYAVIAKFETYSEDLKWVYNLLLMQLQIWSGKMHTLCKTWVIHSYSDQLMNIDFKIYFPGTLVSWPMSP